MATDDTPPAHVALIATIEQFRAERDEARRSLERMKTERAAARELAKRLLQQHPFAGVDATWYGLRVGGLPGHFEDISGNTAAAIMQLCVVILEGSDGD